MGLVVCCCQKLVHKTPLGSPVYCILSPLPQNRPSFMQIDPPKPLLIKSMLKQNNNQSTFLNPHRNKAL